MNSCLKKKKERGFISAHFPVKKFMEEVILLTAVWRTQYIYIYVCVRELFHYVCLPLRMVLQNVVSTNQDRFRWRKHSVIFLCIMYHNHRAILIADLFFSLLSAFKNLYNLYNLCRLSLLLPKICDDISYYLNGRKYY